MTTTMLSHAQLESIVARLVATGTRVVAPVAAGDRWNETEYRPIRRLDEAALGTALPRNALKDFFGPADDAAPQVILGAWPCDAASIENLDHVIWSDRRRDAWAHRREATTIVTIACAGADRSCFCSAVGRGPDSAKGADVLLVPLAKASATPAQQQIVEELRRAVEMYLYDCQPYEGALELEAGAAPPAIDYLAEAVTAKGEALLARVGDASVQPADLERAAGFVRTARESARSLAALPPANGSTALDALPRWLAHSVDHPLWRSLEAACQSCGSCAAACATSHCDDRHGPAIRLRERVMQKFCIEPASFEELLCTGCGRCARVCKGGINLPAILGQLVGVAGAEVRAA